LSEDHLQHVDKWFLKIIQLYEISLVRHGFMMVGNVGTGKTTIMNCLMKCQTLLNNPHKGTRLNPKSFLNKEMYGSMNNVTGEWVPGVFS
jgi:dynein heavy chain